MAADLVERRLLIRLSRSEVTAQLGEPDVTEHGALQALRYEIHTDYGHDIDPVSGAYLVVEFGDDNLVSGVRIEDWKLTE